MCERHKRWLVFSEEECGFSLKEAGVKDYECNKCKLEIEGERKKIMEINEVVNVVVAELERERKC